jgi:hypothetical protein
MAIEDIEVDLNFQAIAKLIRAIHNPVAADPGTPVNGEIWYNTTSNELKYQANGATRVFASMDDVTAAGISANLFDANTILKADSDNTPVALTLGASTVLGRRATGGIIALSYANLIADLEGVGLNANALGGQTGSYYLSRANHTGDQPASSISDFTTAVNALITTALDGLRDGVGTALDTLNELADALGNDPNFATTVTTAIGLKLEMVSQNFGNGTLQIFDISHGLATTTVGMQCFDNATGLKVRCGEQILDANTVRVTTVSVPPTNKYRIHIWGRNL